MLDELVALGWPRARITLDEWDTLPEDNETRVECVEGMVVPMVPPDSQHQRAILRLCALLGAALPPEREALPEVGVILEREPLTVRIPDVSVVVFDERSRTLFATADVALIVEIVSPGSGRVDRILKLREYADAAVPEYWILDRSVLLLSTYELRADGYVLTGEHRGEASIETCGVTVAVDVTTLV